MVRQAKSVSQPSIDRFLLSEYVVIAGVLDVCDVVGIVSVTSGVGCCCLDGYLERLRFGGLPFFFAGGAWGDRSALDRVEHNAYEYSPPDSPGEHIYCKVARFRTRDAQDDKQCKLVVAVSVMTA